ncbi:Mrp/NBP35 family ATP-binding protein [Eggerthia catenaformis]|uniref:Mrp/NBP35 family ATP-binding protein n=1 Tax=Eggerthia catenaformis TaxID=31973 RepID=UPI00248D8A54|nr:Mrp/NBP35 family ATP-binding protein [Eggerthia catenaformis]
MDERIKAKFTKQLNKKSKVKKVIAVMSGKGGVGKSLVTSKLAVEMTRRGYKAAIMDADITGPSIPQAFNLHGQIYADENKLMFPSITASGIQVISINLMIDDETKPVVWRGPIIADMVSQFWTDVYWEDVDYMFVDMPPGTGDVPLTVFQNLPVDGVVIVTSPQDLVSMIVSKAVHMVETMHLPILGIVENMSYFKCPECGHIHSIFGESHIDNIASKYHIATISKLPVDPKISQLVDQGKAEALDNKELYNLIDKIETL